MRERNVYRYRMAKSVTPAEAEVTFLLAISAVESLHGEAAARLDARHTINETGRIYVLDARTAVGRDLNKLFCGFLRRQFGDDEFSVEHVDPKDGRICDSIKDATHGET